MKYKKTLFITILIKIFIAGGIFVDGFFNESCTNKQIEDKCRQDIDCIIEDDHSCRHQYIDYSFMDKLNYFFCEDEISEERRLHDEKKHKQSIRHKQTAQDRFNMDLPYNREVGVQCDPYGGPGHCGISSSASYLMNHPNVNAEFKKEYHKLSIDYSNWTRAEKISFLANNRWQPGAKKIIHPHNLVNNIVQDQKDIFKLLKLPYYNGVPISVNYDSRKVLIDKEKEEQFTCLKSKIIFNQEKNKSPTLIGIYGEIYPGLAGTPVYNHFTKQLEWNAPSISGHAVNVINYHKKALSENSDDSVLLDDPNNLDAIRVKVNKLGEVYTFSKYEDRDKLKNFVRLNELRFTGDVTTWHL